MALADDYVLVIRDDITPGQHERQYNTPTINEVTIVIIGEEFNSYDIVLHRMDGYVQQVSETRPSYDKLQYPILFKQGEYGLSFQDLRNPQIHEVTKRKSES